MILGSASVITILASVVLTGLGCATVQNLTGPDDIKFAVIGNTMPGSPFKGEPEYLPAVIEKINLENPVLTIHTGNLTRGGNDWNGVREEDMNRQHSSFKTAVSGLNSLLHTLLGETDLHNEKPDLYRRNIEDRLNYSFNYGNIHFIILDTVYSYKKNPEALLSWLSDDLKKYSRAKAVFVISHSPFINISPECTQVEGGSRIHNVLKGHPVRAVISGCQSRFKEATADGILYLSPGCGSYTREDRFKRYRHYLIIEMKEGNLTVKSEEIKLTAL